MIGIDEDIPRVVGTTGATTGGGGGSTTAVNQQVNNKKAEFLFCFCFLFLLLFLVVSLFALFCQLPIPKQLENKCLQFFSIIKKQ